MCDATGLSQRRACRLTGLSLSTCRYEAQRPAADTHLSGRITELALERRRFGYRRIWQLLRREGLHVNHKRVYARSCMEVGQGDKEGVPCPCGCGLQCSKWSGETT